MNVTDPPLSFINQNLLDSFPHYYTLTKEMPDQTEICVPRNNDLELYCNVTQYEEKNLCSSEEMFIEEYLNYRSM